MDARSHEVIAPLGQDVTLAEGRTVNVKPITVGQLPRFVKAIRPVFGALVALAPVSSSPGADGGQGAESAEGELDPVALLELYAEHGQALNEAITICTGMQTAEVEALDLEQAFTLVRAVWEVNRDFFVQRVKPLLLRQT